ncbi:D-aminoacyl-tRNA deacylase [Bienertia sinuspersici]
MERHVEMCMYGRVDERRRVNGERIVTYGKDDDYESSKNKISKTCECSVMIYASLIEDTERQIRRAVNEHKNHDKLTPRKSQYINMYRKRDGKPC